MKRKGLTLVEVLITCSLLMIFANGINILSTFSNRAEKRLDDNTIAMYSLESVRNFILVDLRSGKNISDINSEIYKKVLSKFPYPITIEKRMNNKVIRIIMKCPVQLTKNKNKTYFREIVSNE